MKKYLFLLLLANSFFLAQGRESNPIAEKVHCIDQFSNATASPAELGLPDQAVVTNTLYRAVKKITDESELTLILSAHCNSYKIAFEKANSSVHSKRYLLHIHPSHHFW